MSQPTPNTALRYDSVEDVIETSGGLENNHKNNTLILPSAKKITLLLLVTTIGILYLSSALPEPPSTSPIAKVPAPIRQSPIAKVPAPIRQTNESHMHSCLHDKYYSKKTVKTVFDAPFVGLLKNNMGEKKFEASGLTKVDDSYYSVCDNSWAISKFHESFSVFSDQNLQIGNPRREKEDSGYEAIFHFNSTFYVVRESIKHYHRHHAHNVDYHHLDRVEGQSSYHAIIEELTLNDTDYVIHDQCRCEFEFEGTSKGFEGAFGIQGDDGSLYVVGLCEGNHCSEKTDLRQDAGNGKVVLMKKKIGDDIGFDGEECIWETVAVIDIPSSAFFRDYSDIDITENGKVVITTQEDSALWIGKIYGIENGILLPEKLKFDDDIGQVFYFPKSNSCETIYCNIEGVVFKNDEMVVAVSDKMKSKGKQPHWCLEKDQSIHAFVVP